MVIYCLIKLITNSFPSLGILTYPRAEYCHTVSWKREQLSEQLTQLYLPNFSALLISSIYGLSTMKDKGNFQKT